MSDEPVNGLPPDSAELRALRDEFQRFLLPYQFGLREIETKVRILQDEFLLLHDYNPIEHISSRVKSADSLVAKVQRKGLDPDPTEIGREITDIAGLRVVCSFTRDAYRLFALLAAHDDITVRDVKDYIDEPKENGYRSLHAIVEVPVFLSTGRVDVPVEVQLRTVAMDFWASLEHKMYYKYDRTVPADLLGELREAATASARWDERMQALHDRLHAGEPQRA